MAVGAPPHPTTSGAPPRAARLGALFLVVFLDLVGFGIVIPQLGVYAVRYEATPFVVGLLLASYSVMQLIFAPVLGRLSDRFGRRPVLLYSIAGSIVGYVLFGIAHTLPLLFLARIIDGISGANISTAQAYVSDITTGENRAKGMGVLGAAFGLGFILGPAIGGFVGGRWGNLGIGVVAALLSSVSWILVLLFLPESRDKSRASDAPRRSLLLVLPQLRMPIVGLGILLNLVVITAFALMEGTFSVYVIQTFLTQGDVPLSGGIFRVQAEIGPLLAREASEKTAWVFVMVGVVSATVQGGLIGRLRKRFGERALIVAGGCLLMLGLGGVPLAPTYGWLFVPMCLLAAGSGLVQPSLSSVVSLAAAAERQGEVLGAYQSMGSLGRILGPLFGGLIFSTAGAAWPYFAGAVLMALGVALAVRLSRAALPLDQGLPGRH